MLRIHKLFAIHPRVELREFYFFSIFFSFASSLILIFEPIFFYKEGVGLYRIALYYALHYFFYVLMLPLGGKFMSRFGLERSLTLAMPLFVTYFLVLAAMPIFPALFWVAWILLTIFKIFYWPAYHTVLARYGDGDNRGTELSWLIALTEGIGVLGPMLGGIVATLFGFPILFIMAALVALAAGWPLLKTKERFQRQRFAYLAPWRLMRERAFRGTLLTMVGWSENLIDLVFWPIFMFMIVGSVDRLGFLASLNILLMTMIGFFVGEVSDRFSRQRILRLHVPFMVLGYLFRPLAGSALRVLLTDALSRTALIGVRIPQYYRLYVKAKHLGGLRYVVAFEMVLALAKGTTALALVAAFSLLTPYAAFSLAFGLAAAFSLLYLFL